MRIFHFNLVICTFARRQVSELGKEKIVASPANMMSEDHLIIEFLHAAQKVISLHNNRFLKL